MEEHTEDARNDEDLARVPVSPRQYAHAVTLIRHHKVKLAVRASLAANFALAAIQRQNTQ